MKTSRDQMADNRRRILAAAATLFRDRGFDAVTVADIMRDAGLTHGAFYGYYASKQDLIAAALADALQGSAADQAPDLAAYAAFYLSASHAADRAHGCPVAALAAETARLDGDARTAMTLSLRRQIARLAEMSPGDTLDQKRRAAIAGWAAMVGALILARVSNDPALSDEILENTRATLGACVT